MCTLFNYSGQGEFASLKLLGGEISLILAWRFAASVRHILFLASPCAPQSVSTTTFIPFIAPLTCSVNSAIVATPVGAIAGGVLAGVLVVGAVILAFLFKTGRLKTCPGGSRNTPADDVVAPGCASGSAPTRGTRVESTAGPTRGRYPVAYQYPAAV